MLYCCANSLRLQFQVLLGIISVSNNVSYISENSFTLSAKVVRHSIKLHWSWTYTYMTLLQDNKYKSDNSWQLQIHIHHYISLMIHILYIVNQFALNLIYIILCKSPSKKKKKKKNNDPTVAIIFLKVHDNFKKPNPQNNIQKEEKSPNIYSRQGDDWNCKACPPLPKARPQYLKHTAVRYHVKSSKVGSQVILAMIHFSRQQTNNCTIPVTFKLQMHNLQKLITQQLLLMLVQPKVNE